LKTLNPEFVAKRIVEGIILKEQEIYLPELTKYLIMVYKIIPTFLKDKLYFLLRIINNIIKIS